jgi:hypothetical protein
MALLNLTFPGLALASPCSKELTKITTGIQIECKDRELEVLSILHWFQGEGADTYILKVRKAEITKNMSVWIQGDDCEGVVINPDPSHCP